MLQEYKNLFPAWTDAKNTRFDLVLGDDADSYLSTVFLLHNFKNYRLNYFYSFNTLYQVQKSRKDKVWLDVDITSGKGWGNHVTMLHKTDTYNKQMANLNIIKKISRQNYTQKYAGSTLLTILSYYNYPMFLFTAEQLKIILAVDAGYKPFYTPHFRSTYLKYLKIMEQELLIEFLRKHSLQDFYKTINKYNLHKKIYVNRYGQLQTKIRLAKLSEVFCTDLTLPNVIFTPIQHFNNCNAHIKKLDVDKKNIFSLALTKKDYVNYSTIK